MIALAVAATAAGTQGEQMTSDNWSGYIVDGGPFSVTTATFNVPNLTASSAKTDTSEWVGVDGSDPTDDSLIQAGVREEYDPHTNLVHFRVWWEILPALETFVRMTVNPGDRMSISIGRSSATRWQIGIRNLTSGQSFAVTRPYRGPGRTADWIVEAPSDADGTEKILGHYVPDVTFSDVRAAGRQDALHAITMVQRGVVVSQVSRLTAHGFSVSYR